MADPMLLDPEMDMLAAELAFGLIEGAERLEAERLRLEDPTFAQAVEQWERHGLSWLEEEQPADGPDEHLWSRIAAGLTREPAAPPVADYQAVEHLPTSLPTPANDPGLWRPFALAASAAALVFAGLWALDRPERVPVSVPVEQPFAPEALSVAQINAPEEGTLLSALYDRETGKLYLRLAELPDPSRVPQLWLIDAGGTPRSLGFGTRGAVSTLELTPQQQQIIEQAGTIAVSLEAPTEVPGDAPTDVLGAADLAPLDQS